MSDTDVFSIMVLVAVLAGSGVKLLLDATKPRHPFTDAALRRHYANEARLAQMEEQRARRSVRPLPPTFTTLGDAANRVVTDLTERRGRWTVEDEAACADESRRFEADGARLVEDFRKRSAG